MNIPGTNSSKINFKYVIGGLLLLGAILLTVFYNPDIRGTTDDDTYVDPNSHETISDPKDKTPDMYGVNPDRPVYLGFSKLFDYGLSSNQVANTKACFEEYFNKQGVERPEVSISVDEFRYVPHPETSSDGRNALYFPVTVNRTEKLSAQLSYIGISNVRLYLTDADKKVVYDSGPEVIVGD